MDDWVRKEERMGEEEIFWGAEEEEELEEVGRPITKNIRKFPSYRRVESGAEGNCESAKVAKDSESGFSANALR